MVFSSFYRSLAREFLNIFLMLSTSKPERLLTEFDSEQLGIISQVASLLTHIILLSEVNFSFLLLLFFINDRSTILCKRKQQQVKYFSQFILRVISWSRLLRCTIRCDHMSNGTLQLVLASALPCIVICMFISVYLECVICVCSSLIGR